MSFNFYEPDRLDTSLMDLGPTINLMSNVRLVKLKRYPGECLSPLTLQPQF
jgi:hypothetical protein